MCGRVLLNYASFLQYSQSCRRWKSEKSIGSHSSPDAPALGSRPVPGLPGDNVCVCSLHHPLKKWSLQQILGGSVKFESFDFTRTTDNAFINAASVLFRGIIKSELLKLSNNYLKSAYEKLQRTATDELSKDFTDGVTSQVTLSYTNVDKILMLEQGIYLSVISEGTWQLNVSPLEFTR